ncbi:MAG TPA: TonB-dependent receptor [Rhizomicrobium sp.]|nr:TonB-dependent receptor [Rhizomicrobium sp.]
MRLRILMFLLAAAAPALAQPVSHDETVIVTGRRADLTGIATSANQGSISAEDLAQRPLLRPGEIVEAIPGVIVSQHSGSGKANQYYLRGFNLDHGTDLAINLDGVPVNNVSHGHGQGYADLNFAIPEMIERVDYRKGPYYADIGDFGAAGAFDIRYFDRLPSNIARVEAGQFGYLRGLAAANITAGAGNAIAAMEIEHNDGPWDRADDARKVSGVLRYSLGGWTMTAQAYHNIWNATDQVPQRAIASGLISRWGNIDPSDGGQSGRYALSTAWRDDDTQVMVYGLYYDLNLFSNFTYFLDDPVNGDQFEQQDTRWIMGGKARKDWNHGLFGLDSRTSFGLDIRRDDIRNGLFHTRDRARLSVTTLDAIAETSLSPWAQNQTRWTDWLRTIAGIRGDVFWFDVKDRTGGGASGARRAETVSPKLGIVLGPWAHTEFYLDGGYGFHSNDARGLFSPAGPDTPLARATGAEIGIRTGAVPGLQSAVSVWLLNIQSELVWAGDTGMPEPSGRSRRFGVEFTNSYAINDWLTVQADYAWSRARLVDFDPAGQHIPEALASTFDGGVALHDLDWARDWFGGLRLRHFGPRPLVQDNSVRSRATTLVYANLGYNISERLTLALDVFNLFDAKVSDIDYFYTSRLMGEPAGGVDDLHTHPSEPREIRLSLTARF